MSPQTLDSSCSACAFPSALVAHFRGGGPKVGESNLAEPQQESWRRSRKQATNQVSCSERRSMQWSGRFLGTIGWDPSVYKSGGDNLKLYIAINHNRGDFGHNHRLRSTGRVRHCSFGDAASFSVWCIRRRSSLHNVNHDLVTRRSWLHDVDNDHSTRFRFESLVLSWISWGFTKPSS